MDPEFKLNVCQWVNVSSSLQTVSDERRSEVKLEIWPSLKWTASEAKQSLTRIQTLLDIQFPSVGWFGNSAGSLLCAYVPEKTLWAISPDLVALFNHCVEWRFYSESLQGRQVFGSHWQTSYFSHVFRCVGEKVALDASNRDALYPEDWDVFAKVLRLKIPISKELETLVGAAAGSVAAGCVSLQEIQTLNLPEELREVVWRCFTRHRQSLGTLF